MPFSPQTTEIRLNNLEGQKTMTKVQHTPGPWEVVRYSNAQQRAFEVVDQHSQTVACVFTDQDESNARLIAAAPELLEALKKAVTYADYNESGLHEGDIGRAILRELRAAIAKAEGK